MTGRTLRITKDAFQRLVGVCTGALPGKSFGLISGREAGLAEEVHAMTRNLRPTSAVVGRVFESYGEFYRDPDRGFCFDPEELKDIEGKIRGAGRRVTAVYHSHRLLQARPTPVDVDFHYSPEALLVIVSVVDPACPQVAAFHVRDGAFEEASIEVLPD